MNNNNPYGSGYPNQPYPQNPPTNVNGIIGGMFQPTIPQPTNPVYPGQPGLPNQQGYPTNQPGYPSGPGYPAQPTYPSNQPGYPANQPGYPSQPSYPGQQPSQQGYPAQSTYPSNQPGYPANQPGYPSQPSYPGQQPSQQGYPAQPGYPSNQPGYPSQPTYPSQAGSIYPNVSGGGYGNNNKPWDERAYLKGLFDEMDRNRDGRIATQELHEALRKGQGNAEFDPYTVSVVLQKYDRDHDGQIEFNEFFDLYNGLTGQFNEFLDFDADNSGSIDGRELTNIMRRKGYNFSPDLFNYVVYEISRRSGKNGVSFDTYVRVIARFDFLRTQYNSNKQLQNMPLEAYIRNSFF